MVGATGPAVLGAQHTPFKETQYRMRFYFDPNTIEMSNGDSHAIFYGYVGNAGVILQSMNQVHTLVEHGNAKSSLKELQTVFDNKTGGSA